MFDIHRVEIEWGGRKLKLETGHMARQADGAVLATYGDTTVLATVVYARQPKPGVDFFPLTVNYQEKTYAAGKFPGGYFKREGRPTEKETLVSRLIDRPIRPLFVDGFRNEVQVIVTVISFDNENDPDIVGMVAASAALTISGVPFLGPIGAARVGLIDGQMVLNPLLDEMAKTKLDLVIAGTHDAVMMVESEAHELPEMQMLEAVMFGHKHFQPVIQAIIKLADAAAKEPFDFQPPEKDKFTAQVKALVEADLRAAFTTPEKQKRNDMVAKAKEKVMAGIQIPEGENAAKDKQLLSGAFKQVEMDVMRGTVVKTGQRIDGRDLKTVRPIISEVGILPRTHGSALFTRGETQALVVATLGTGDDEQFIDGLEGTRKERFLLHYNFPPYSVGETGRMGSPGRREIGHGKLAWRAVHPLLPAPEEFPYSIRIVSEITESNGSSSMASVCGASLAMMDAGVPMKRPVAGIAMGLIKEGNDYAVLSDILGDEDHLGDMDFKVAGTSAGVTSLQMDIKITGITEEIMRIALNQAQEGRLHILGEMSKAITGARTELGETAPRIETIKIPVDKIREVIGSGGSVIRDIVATSGAKINVEDDGTVQIASSSREAIEKALTRIRSITSEPEVGQIYKGKVVKLMEFGAFVNFFGAKDGLVHVSQLTSTMRPNHPNEVVKEGQEVWVKLLGFDDRGKVRLSMKIVDQETGKEIPRAEGEPEEDAGFRRERPPRRDGDRGGDRPRRRDR
jgi:polyribonucleotide nucleotidyltransferase